MKPARIAVWVAGGVLLLQLRPALAGPSGTERRCERTVAKASSKFVRAALSAPDDHARATAAFRKAILNACPDAAVASIGFGGECTGATTGLALARCLVGSHEGRVAWFAAILGAEPPGAAKDLRKCRATVAGAMRASWLQHAEALDRCKMHPPEGLPPGLDCTSTTPVLQKEVQLNERLLERIPRYCTDQLVTAAAFGLPCNWDSALGIANCVILAALDTAEHLTAATHRDRGFCGDAADQVEQRIDELRAQMTREEKVSQMHGAVLDRGWRTAAIERLGIPGLGMLDGPRGVSAIAGGNGTSFPVGIARGATFDPALEEAVGSAIALEVRAKGADVVLAPVLNIVRHPRGGRTQESYSEDTMHLGEMGAAFVRGAQQYAIASAKHFAVNSIENTRFEVDVQVDERALREVYLPHFQRVVAPGAAAFAAFAYGSGLGPISLFFPARDHAASVMSAYNKVNGSYCSENTHLLHDVLKGDWRFQGFVESDWIFGTHSTVPALEAGLDIEMPSGQYFGAPLLDALASGAASEDDVDAAVRRVLRAQLCFQLDTYPPVPDRTFADSYAHAQLARQVAEQAIVLLKNDGPTLPLARATMSSLVVVGTVADTANLGDTGSSAVRPPGVVMPLEGITKAAGSASVTHIAGPPLDPADAAAIAAADAAIVVVGLTTDDEGEGQVTHGDRDSLVLPRDQDAFVSAVAALNPRTIVVLQGSGPVLMPWLNEVPAVLETWYLGQQGGTALGEVLFGDVAPTGKLPLSFPVAESDLPPFDNVSPSVTYDYWSGYRHLDRAGTTPLFPFGFGLTYTTFAFSNLTVTPAQVPAGGHVRVSVEVTAAEAPGGVDVVQLYVGYQGSAVERAPRDLKAFARVSAGPGAPATVVFDLPTANLAYWDVATSQWVIEPITYDVYVGDSSRDTPVSGTFTVTPF